MVKITCRILRNEKRPTFKEKTSENLLLHVDRSTDARDAVWRVVALEGFCYHELRMICKSALTLPEKCPSSKVPKSCSTLINSGVSSHIWADVFGTLGPKVMEVSGSEWE